MPWIGLRTAAFFGYPIASFLYLSLDSMLTLGVKGEPGRFATPALRMLAKWFQTTRLETRTKESNIYASIWVANPYAK